MTRTLLLSLLLSVGVCVGQQHTGYREFKDGQLVKKCYLDDDKCMNAPTKSDTFHRAKILQTKPEPAPKSESMDVPAVEIFEIRQNGKPASGEWREGDILTMHDAYTCTDKRRAKIQSEDGKWHCILFDSSRTKEKQ